MKKILLINPGQDKGHYKHKSHREVHRDPPPVALLYIGTYLSEFGYDIEIIDTHIEKNYIEIITKKIIENKYIYIGLTTIIGSFMKNAREITNLIREVDPDIPIVWGGIMASIAPEACLKEYKPDFIIRYEGEETSLELAKALENNIPVDNIKGISYLKDNSPFNNPARLPKKNLDEYPIPKWSLLGESFNIEQEPYYYLIMTSKGCIFNCKFCYKHSVDETIRKKVPPWRYRSAQHIINEIEYIHQNTGTRVFSIGDDNFLVKKKRAIEILDYIRKRNFYLEETTGHINILDDNIIDHMAGIVQSFGFSIESASPRLQKLINKKVKLEDVPIKVKNLYKVGINCDVSFIIGLPSEKKEDLKKNIEIMLGLKEINPFIRGNIYLYFPLPKTELFEIAESMYNVKIPINMVDLEEANFWVKNPNDPIGKKFRPWLDDNTFNFLVSYGYVFNDVFKVNNLEFSETTKDFLKNNSEIRELFKGIKSVKHPNTNYRPYVLNRVLKGEKIDLINDLKGK